MDALIVVCPKCKAAIGGKCLTKTLWGNKYIDMPHAERVAIVVEAVTIVVEAEKAKYRDFTSGYIEEVKSDKGRPYFNDPFNG